MIYDGNCSFCRFWIDYWKQLTGDAIEYAPYQEVADQHPEIQREQFMKAVQLIGEDGIVFSGARAVVESLAAAQRKRWILWVFRYIPGVAQITELCYRFIARHRNAAYKLTSRLLEVSNERSSHENGCI